MVATILAPNKKKAVMWVRNLEPGKEGGCNGHDYVDVVMVV